MSMPQVAEQPRNQELEFDENEISILFIEQMNIN
jgi:hypothetical protein